LRLLIAGLIGIGAGCLLALWQFIGWLETGVWREISVRYIVGSDTVWTSWVGLNLIFNWIADSPLAAAIGIAGGAIVYVGATIENSNI
jgi:hypothetical protein